MDDPPDRGMGAALYPMTRRRDGFGLRLLVLLTVLVTLILPILAGLAQTAAVAFGHLPAIGQGGFTFDPWRQLLSMPGARSALISMVVTGVVATALSLAMALAVVAEAQRRMGAGLLSRLAVPLLAAPHAAMAIGLAFVIAPSGWAVRLVSPWLTGWQVPPDLPLVHDPWGGAMILGLAAKELPFFLLVILTALTQFPAERQMAAARSMGYGCAHVWLWILGPQIYRLIRLPVYVVLVFSLSVVDISLILGPSNPPTLPVAVMRWLLSPEVRLVFAGAAGAMAIVLVAALMVGLWMLSERAMALAGRRWISRGSRGRALPLVQAAFALSGVGVIILAFLSLLSLMVWSFARQWRFPETLPRVWSLEGWLMSGAAWRGPLLTSLGLGLVTVALALTLTIIWLEAEDRGHLPRARWAEALIYLPLMVPQIALLYGLQIVALRLGISGGIGAVVWVQAIYVFPYVMIALSDPWRAFDQRMLQMAALLGAGPWRRLFRVRLPCLLGPIMTATAIGFSVSVAQYLPTLFLGEGRVATLTTEAVTLSSGADRRIAAIYGLLQTILPLLCYALAIAVPRMRFRNRRALSGAVS